MDRIFEAYNGTGGFKPEFMRKTRERLHWTCSQVWGRKALDVGCSQGIGPILLGRMGIDVLGVDVNPEAIAFAKRELEKESDGVRRKVRFVCEDFVQFKNDEWAQVDAIVMGEVLEHLVRPADFIGRAFQLLKPAGRLVVTVPFGINDDPDHRQTFYLTSVYSFLFPYFEVASVRFFGGWIGFVGKRRAAKTADPVAIPTRLFAQAEDAFNKLERPLVDLRTKAKDYSRQIEEEQARSGELSGQLAALQAKITALETVSRRSDVVVVEDQVQELKTSLAVERQTNSGHQEQIALLKAALQLASQQKPDAANETRLLEYSQEVKDLRASLDSKSAELVERAERCGRLAAECESSRARVAEMEAKLDVEAKAREESLLKADELGKRFEAQAEQIATQSAQVKSQAARIEELEAELARRRTWTEQHKRESKDVRMQLFSVQNELAEKTRALTAAESRYEAESKAHQESLAKIDELGEQTDDQALRITELTAERDRAMSERDSVLVEREDERKKLAVLRSETDARIAELVAACEASDKQAVRIKALETELAEQEKKLQGNGAALAKSEAACISERKAKQESEAKVADLVKQVEALKKESSGHLAELAKLRAENMTLTARCDSAEKARKEISDQANSSAQTIRRLNGDLAKTKEKLSKTEKRLDVLSKAKLCRLTLKYWKFKDAVLGRTPKTERIANNPKSETTDDKSIIKELPKGDESFFERMSAKIAGMPVSNGCRYYTRFKTRIGIICDRFYWDSVKDAADFVYLSPAADEVTLSTLDCLLVVSTWNGLKDDEWKGISTEGRPRRKDAERIIEMCHKNRIKTVFYSKEDPPNYDLYVGLAQKCDYVFTSAAECIPDYVRDCGHNRVYAMPFCINPQEHNPVGMRFVKMKERNVIFSGSWMEKYPHRCHDLDVIFSGVLKSGRELNIVDRNYALRGNPMYRYPDRYLKYLSPAIGHSDLQKVHKVFDWAVNINTVKDSSTMFANRVYELQASGNLLLSNYSVGVSNILPTVFLVHDSDEAVRILQSFSDEEVYERQISGVRRVMSGETCFDRIAEMLTTVGLATNVSSRKVLVIADRDDSHVQEMFERQSYSYKRLVVSDRVTEDDYNWSDIVAFFDHRAEYGVFYLEDMINGFKYTNCDYITKTAYLKAGGIVKGKEHDYVDKVASKYRTVFWRASFSLNRLLKLHNDVKIANGYAIDHFNFDLKPKRPASFKPEISVIIPCYNNGWFLYGRSFASLRRSSLFNKMEILVIDDGSTDGITPLMGLYLESLYPNVRTYRFPRGGSGTPSRPRNKGVEIARGCYILFHDPDNEAVSDGYGSLYKEILKDSALDFVLGNTIKCDGQSTLLDYCGQLSKNTSADAPVDVRDLLVKSKFMSANIQTMIIRRSFLIRNRLEQVVGGTGEDSLFCQQMMAVAGKMRAFPVTAQIYYAERGDSIVNAVGLSFFEKHLITERVRVSWLRASGLLDDYMQRRFATYVTGWYFKKLGMVLPENREACCRKLLEIFEAYGSAYQGGDAKIDKFLKCSREGDFQTPFGDVVPLPRPSSAGKRVEVLACDKIDLSKIGVERRTCSVKGSQMVYVSAKVLGRGLSQDSEKAVVMSVAFAASDGKILKTGRLSNSPKFGEYFYLTAGAGEPRMVRLSIQVPEGAVTLTLGFVKWGKVISALSISDISVNALV